MDRWTATTLGAPSRDRIATPSIPTPPQLLARGIPNRAIAATLTISAKTVSSHVEHIYTKLGVTSRAAATLFAIEHGLVGSYEAPAAVDS